MAHRVLANSSLNSVCEYHLCLLGNQLNASDVNSSICLELHDTDLVKVLKGLGLYEGVAEGKYRCRLR